MSRPTPASSRWSSEEGYVRRTNEKITDAIRSGKPARRIGRARCINPNAPEYMQAGAGDQRWVAAAHERELAIARRINDAAGGR
jgi:hypothetical protein